MKAVLIGGGVFAASVLVMICVVLVRWLSTLTALAGMKTIAAEMAVLAEELNKRAERGPDE